MLDGLQRGLGREARHKLAQLAGHRQYHPLAEGLRELNLLQRRRALAGREFGQARLEGVFAFRRHAAHDNEGHDHADDQHNDDYQYRVHRSTSPPYTSIRTIFMTAAKPLPMRPSAAATMQIPQ